jgi:hypothetical protein
MANVCELTRRGYRDVSLNKIIIKTKVPPIPPFPRASLASIQIDPRSALRGFIAGVLQFGDASELHYCYYGLPVTERLGVEENGGIVRVRNPHYIVVVL